MTIFCPTGLAILIALTNQAHAAPKPLKADYVIYSGDLGEQMPPTKTDRKISINVTGQPAKDIFDAIGSDIKAECLTGKGQRERRKGNVWCFYLPRNGFACYFGTCAPATASTGANAKAAVRPARPRCVFLTAFAPPDSPR